MTRPSNPDPDPRDIPEQDPRSTPDAARRNITGGGEIRPGETPPAESGTSTGTGPYRPLRRGWGKGPLLIVWALGIVCALFFLVYAIVLVTD
ncbi:DUF6480 family protein [Streptomyces sp. NPDC058326]|uniref:DUF6480 family protein n=1 Tax=Streptomyces sp. NPDC058326 TaxID=3346447 RepID=UPI0036E09316